MAVSGNGPGLGGWEVTKGGLLGREVAPVREGHTRLLPRHQVAGRRPGRGPRPGSTPSTHGGEGGGLAGPREPQGPGPKPWGAEIMLQLPLVAASRTDAVGRPHDSSPPGAGNNDPRPGLLHLGDSRERRPVMGPGSRTPLGPPALC
jgi:hypothetical protein